MLVTETPESKAKIARPFQNVGLTPEVKDRVDEIQIERRRAKSGRTSHSQIVEDALDAMQASEIPPEHRTAVGQLVAYLQMPDENLTKSDQINRRYILEILAAYSNK